MTALEFQFKATNFTLMVAKLSDLGDKMSEANLQADCQGKKQAQAAASQCETEEGDNSPTTC